MSWSGKPNLKLGSNVVELLIPQRRPFLMVDFTRSYTSEPFPCVEAGRHITANEATFEGHFPGLHVWPGAFTIEGLGQTAVILLVILALRRAASEDGKHPDSVLAALANLDRGFRLEPGYRPELNEDLLRLVRTVRGSVAVGTSVDMKFARPVFAGQRLDYRVSLTGEHASGMRFEAEAAVEGTLVAKGVLMGASVTPPNLRGESTT